MALTCSIIWFFKLYPEQTTWTALFVLFTDVVSLWDYVALVMNERVWSIGGIRLTRNDRNGRAVEGVGLLPLACWDYWFESRRGHGCLSVVNVCYQVEFSAMGRSLIKRSRTECVSLSVIKRNDKPLHLQWIDRIGQTKKGWMSEWMNEWMNEWM
jgi:hypothetical protein